MPRDRARKILGVENFSGKLEIGETIKPMLDHLSANHDVPHVYRYVDSVDALERLIDLWRKRRKTYSLLYLGFHGHRDGMYIGDSEFTLTELSDCLAGKCRDAIVFLGSCFVMSSRLEDLDDLLDRSEARALVGYTKSVDWLEGSACDLIALGRLAWDVNPSTAASAVLRHEHLAKLTGFRYLDGTKDYAG